MVNAWKDADNAVAFVSMNKYFVIFERKQPVLPNVDDLTLIFSHPYDPKYFKLIRITL